jgi:hypothetical protein
MEQWFEREIPFNDDPRPAKRQRIELKQRPLTEYGFTLVPRSHVATGQSVAQILTEKYCNPMYFPSMVTRRGHHMRLYRDETVHRQLAEGLVKRFRLLEKSEVPYHKYIIGPAQHVVQGTIPQRLVSVSVIGGTTVHTVSTNPDGKHPVTDTGNASEYVGGYLDKDRPSGLDLWAELKRRTAAFVLLYGLHPSIGRDSSVLRMSRHVLSERRVWSLTLSFLGLVNMP